MPRNYTIVLCIIMLLPISAGAQINPFSHSIGGGTYTARQYLGAAVIYSPRFNFIRFSESSTISFESNIAAGLSIGDNYNSNTGGNSTSIFMFNMPLLLTWNTGHLANSNTHTKIGYFAGAGWGFHNSAYSISASDDEEATPVQMHVSGLSISTGVRWPIGKRSFGLRVNWTFNNNQYNPDIKGIAAISIDYSLGNLSN